MVTIDIRHKVGDFAAWKAIFDAAREQRRAAGEIACRIYLAHGSRDDVLVSMDWESLDRAKVFLAHPRLMEGMTRAGVIGMPKILILEAQDSYTL
jgi:hypothetical protein